MATEKVGIYRRWLEPVPNVEGQPLARSLWSKYRRFSWTVRWFGVAGKRYGKSFKTKALAEEYARRIECQVHRREQDRPGPIMFHEFSTEHVKIMQGQVAHATLCDQARALKLFEDFVGGSVMLQQIRPRHAEAFVAKRLASGVTVATVNKDIRTLKRIFNVAIQIRGYLLSGQNPFAAVKQRRMASRTLRYISVQEYQRLLEAADSLWWQAIISLAYGSGLRRGEALNLMWNDLDLEAQQVYIQAKPWGESSIEWEPKNHEVRRVPLPRVIRKYLEELHAESTDHSPYVFVGTERLRQILRLHGIGRWHSKCEIICNAPKTFTRIYRRAGLLKCTLHDLRRSAITNWAQQLPIHIVQKFAGHSSIATTRKYYLTVPSNDLLQAHRTVDEILQGPAIQPKGCGIGQSARNP